LTSISDPGGRTYKWHATHHLVMMHMPMKLHEILKKNGTFDLY